jgi:capsule polysaccharide export protein KpsE/RkpR
VKNSQIKPLNPVPSMPKALAIEKVNQQIAGLQTQLEEARALMASAQSPGKYALNSRVNALKKQLHACKLQIDRIRKDPKAEVPWPDRFSA